MRKRRRRRLRWGDVQAHVVKMAASRIKKLRKKCLDRMACMPGDAVLAALGIRARTTFKLYGVAYKLEFDISEVEWVLNFAYLPDGGIGRRKSVARKTLRGKIPARAQRARRGRKTTLKRILFISYKLFARNAARTWSGKISPRLASTLQDLRADWAECVALISALGAAASSRIKPQDAVIAWFNALAPIPQDEGARLEESQCGEQFGLTLHTWRPVIGSVIDWDAWLFGRPDEESERALA